MYVHISDLKCLEIETIHLFILLFLLFSTHFFVENRCLMGAAGGIVT